MPPTRVLFVCGKNQLRSPTAEQVFAGDPRLEVDSAGLDPGCANPVTPEQLAWAEVVLVMERAHLRRLRARFGSHLGHLRLRSLDIPDDYALMQPELVARLGACVPRALGW